MTSLNVKILILGSTLVLSACGSNRCPITKHQSIGVEAVKFTKPTTLETCLGGGSPISKKIEYSNSGNYTVGTEYAHDRPSRYDGSCSDFEPRDADVEIPFALTASSFGEAKLCWSNKERTHGMILFVGDTCPVNTTEQTHAVTDCGKIME